MTGSVGAEAKAAGTGGANGKAAPGSADNRWWVLTAVGIGTFMSALDGSVANIIQPVLVRSLHSPVSTVAWTVIIYLLLVSGLPLAFGRWGDMHGQKRVFMAGFVVFVVASALCGLSSTAAQLIGFRALQAIGAAMLYASGPAIITHTFPAEMRGRALGIQLTMTYLGLMFGPLFGGWLTDKFGWGSAFFINVPIGVPALYLAGRYVPREIGSGVGKRIDVLGGALFLAGLVALLLALDQAPHWGWTSALTLGVAALGVAILVVFFIVEARIKDPMLDLKLLRNRLFGMAGISSMLNYVGLYTNLFLIPFYCMRGLGWQSREAGLLLCIQPAAMAVIAAASGGISDRIGTRIPATLGMGILAVGLFLLSLLGPTSQVLAGIGLAIAGLGTGMFVSPNNSAMLGVAPPQQRGVASGIMATVRNVGMVLGSGMASAIYTSTTGGHMSLPIGDPAIFRGVHYGCLAACIVAVVGMCTSFVRE